MDNDLNVLTLYNEKNMPRIKAFNSAVKSEYEVQTNYEQVDVNFEWLEIMEDTVRYLDNILRNPNRFIVNEEEIVKIEKALEKAEPISKMIDESGLSDKELGGIIGLSVQSINKWRHGHNLPDIENLFFLSRIFGIKVDDFLVPLVIKPQFEAEFQPEAEDFSASVIRRLWAYYIRLVSHASIYETMY